MNELIPLFVAIGSLVVGSVLGYFARRSIARHQAKTVESKLDKLIGEAKKEATDIIFKAKEKAVKALDELKREEQIRRDEYSRTRKRFEQREEMLDKKEEGLKGEEDDLKIKAEQVRKIKDEINELKEQEIKKLEEISTISREAAKEELFKLAESQYQKDLFDQLKKLEEGRKDELEKDY